jgi:hypothetical protein
MDRHINNMFENFIAPKAVHFSILLHVITKFSMALSNFVQLHMRQFYRFHLHYQWKHAMHFVIKPYLCIYIDPSLILTRMSEFQCCSGGTQKLSLHMQVMYLPCHYVIELSIHIISEKLHLEPTRSKEDLIS